MRKDKMALVGFMQASNTSDFPGSWLHPESRSDFLTADYFQEIARILERGKFHAGFFDDRLALPDLHGGSHRHAVQAGVRAVKLDVATVLAVMSTVTKNLGLGATYSTTYYHPFHIARLFQTLDNMSGGRIAWNVVTSLNDSEAQNMGQDALPAHDSRYDVADEIMEAIFGLWRSWDYDALIVDKESRQFADPDKVHRVDYNGNHVKTKGPLTVPRSPQGNPVILQAGESQRGEEFAARWAEMVFSVAPTKEAGQKKYANFKQLIDEAGRDRNHCKVLPLLKFVVGKTQSEAEDKKAIIDGLVTEEASLSLLSEITNFDFAKKAIDEPFSQEDLDAMTGGQSFVKRVVDARPNPTPRDFMEVTGRGTFQGAWVGTGEDIADRMAEWFHDEACDGFVVAASHVPGGYADFVDNVVPELQKREVFHTEYAGTTLRENLGLPLNTHVN
jgi:FMN-dependent oxidoreductase (nitrilotriacetate monooxygenase family)